MAEKRKILLVLADVDGTLKRRPAKDRHGVRTMTSGRASTLEAAHLAGARTVSCIGDGPILERAHDQ
jgi:hypothetical protein